jgi:TRAP-type mannitol/chloroaromatic compound transport system permease large subunit
VIIVAKVRPAMAPPLPMEERGVPLSAEAAALAAGGHVRALSGMVAALFKGRRNRDVPLGALLRYMGMALAPLAVTVLLVATVYQATTRPEVVYDIPAELRLGSGGDFDSGLAEPPSGELAEPPSNEPAAGGLSEPPGAAPAEPAGATPDAADAAAPAGEGIAAPAGFWIFAGICAAALLVFYAVLTWARLEIFRMLMSSFFPLAVMIAAVLGSIAFGLATPSEAAAMGAMGGALLALAYRRLNLPVLRESVFLTAKTSAMVCWLFVGSSIFSAAFALLGGQRIIEEWVLSLGLSQLQFLLLAQIIIFLLGWPLEWTEIIVIFMPIFVPLLNTFGIDPLFFGLLVALNLQTAFLSPPVAMSAFYLKGVSPPHVTLNEIFLGMMPFMGIQVIAIFLLYVFPGIGMWLPTVLYR